MSVFVLYFFMFFSICILNANLVSWEISQFVWSAGMGVVCDIGPEKDPKVFFMKEQVFDPTLYQNIQGGDIVWLPCRFLEQFATDILPNVTSPFVLLINDARGSDESFPSDCSRSFNVEEFVANSFIIHIFAQNCDYQGRSSKVSHVPIGIDFHTIAYKGENGGWGEIGSPHQQEAVLIKIIDSAKPTNLRKKLAFIDFHHSDTMHANFNRYLQFREDRKSIFQTLLSTGLIEHENWMKRYDLWRKKVEYAFSISPHGNGLDCHRTWEDLALGCIVIVKSSPLDPLYEGLPVVIVKDWSEITNENMNRWLELHGDALHNSAYREKITHKYWYEKILKSTLGYRENTL